MFERPHHQMIANILFSLDASLLRECHCYFGGGTAVALRYGEFRESVDIDFLVSDREGYRTLRQEMTGPEGIAAIVRKDAPPLVPSRDVRADQYGIRTALRTGNAPVKFEVVLEGRIRFEQPGPSDTVCGVTSLSRLDLVTSKILANSDRWLDDSVVSRDLIDLAMMQPSRPLLAHAIDKATGAYGHSAPGDLSRALARMQERSGWLDHCMKALSISTPKAVLWQNLRTLESSLPDA